MTQPRKLILLHSDDLTISLMRLPLECNIKYRVIAEDTETGALATLEAGLQLEVQPIALVIYDCRVGHFATVERMKAIAPRMPVLLLGTDRHRGMLHGGDWMLIRPSMAELLERVKAMTARKRWTRRHPVLSVGIEREAVCA